MLAERRMFAKTIVLSDEFLDMPPTARCLYFTLGMFADDDGFVNSPKGIMRQCGASEDDLKILLAKKFLLAFESGVIVIKHWRINNYLQKDRYKSTVYEEEKALLEIDEKGNYHKTGKADGIEETESMYTQDMYTQDVYTQDMYTQDVYTQVRLGKVSIGKVINTGRKSAGFDLETALSEYSWTEEMKDTIRDWFSYKREQRKGYKDKGAKAFLTQVKNYIDEFGEPAVRKQILDSMSNNYQGAGLDRIPTSGGWAKPRPRAEWERPTAPTDFDDLISMPNKGGQNDV